MLLPLKDALSRPKADRICDLVLGNPELLPELMEAFFAGESETTTLAAMATGLLARERPEWLQSYQQRMYTVCNEDVHPGVLRNAIRYFSELPILVPEDFLRPGWIKPKEVRLLTENAAIPGKKAWLEPELEGVVLDLALRLIDNVEVGAAPRAFSMFVAQHLLVKYPDIAPELEETVRNRMDSATAGFRARGRQLLGIIGRIP